MAKELPYFKFEPAEWEAGNIQAVSREAKGLFIEICSLYWIRLGELPYALALQKLCYGNAELMQELKTIDIIGVIDGQIIVEFLDEQLDEFQKTSEKRAKAANKRWSDAKGMQVHSKSNAIREEKKREEEIKKEKTIVKESKTKVLMSEANASDVTDKNKDFFEAARSFYLLFLRNSTDVLDVEWNHLKKAQAEEYCNHIRLMVEQDNRQLDDIRLVWKFLAKDDFWMKNIQSTKKLREKFDQLITKAKNYNNGKSTNQGIARAAKEHIRDWDKF